MGSRRRNLLILLFVVGLVIASVLVILSKPSRLGLDLRGGTELVYQARPTPAEPEHRPRRHRAGDRDHPRPHRRARSLRAGDRPGRTGPRSRSGCPTSRTPSGRSPRSGARPSSSSTTGSRTSSPTPTLRRAPTSCEAGFNRQIDAVRFATKEKAECFEDECTTTGPTLLPLRREHLRAARRPRAAQVRPLPRVRGRGTASELRRHRGPAGDAASSTTRPEDNPETEADESETGPHEYFVIRDRPSLSGADITDPEAEPRSADELAERHLQLHRRRAAEVRGRDPRDRPARCRRRGSAGRDRTGRRAGRAVQPGLRDRPRQRGRHPPDHQLRREPGRDRRPHRRPDLGPRLPGVPGPGRVPAHRRAARRAAR